MNNTERKAEALRQMEQARESIANSEKIIAAIDAEPSFKPISKPANGSYYTMASATAQNGVEGYRNYGSSRMNRANHIIDQTKGDAFYKSIQTEIDLYAQPGVVEPKNNVEQYMVLRNGFSSELTITELVDLGQKLNRIGPCFNTYNDASQAIRNIGSTRIQAMLKSRSFIA